MESSRRRTLRLQRNGTRRIDRHFRYSEPVQRSSAITTPPRLLFSQEQGLFHDYALVMQTQSDKSRRAIELPDIGSDDDLRTRAARFLRLMNLKRI